MGHNYRLNCDYDRCATHKTEEGEILDIRRSRIQSAMRTANAQIPTSLKFSKLDAFIRTRFEALYDRLEELEKLIRLNIINFEDVETVFRYYMIRPSASPRFDNR